MGYGQRSAAMNNISAADNLDPPSFNVSWRLAKRARSFAR